MIRTSRRGLVAVAFIASAVLGGPLLLLWDLAVAYGSLMVHRHGAANAGIGAAAGGVSAGAAVMVPLVCGTMGAIWANFRLKR